MTLLSLTPAHLAIVLVAIFTVLPFTSSSISGYSAEVEDQSVITIYDAYPQRKNPKPQAKKQKVCHGEVGCFTLTGPFKHHPSLPQAPEVVKVKMRLNTRESGPELEKSEILDWRNPQTLVDSTFDPKKPTYIHVHGWRNFIDKPWLVELMQVSLAMDDVNAIRVGWAGGAQTSFIDYPQAAADTRLVGAEIALLIGKMVELGADLDSIWLVGHSLGAHIMSYVGRRIPGIGRITGLDPAEPYFQGYHIDARLDPTDANFVDVIHTDINNFATAMGFGSKDPMGHVDFYPNGGRDQPGCNMTLINIGGLEDGIEYLACNHQRAYKILIEAMRAKVEGRSCRFKAHRCSSYESYLKEECQNCGEGCTFLGPEARATRPKTTETLVKMYLLTLGSAPYCVEKFFDFSVALSSGFSKDRGQIFVKFNMTSLGGEVVEQEVTAATNDNLLPDHDLHRLVLKRNGIDIDHIAEIQIKFKDYFSILDPSSWHWGKAKIRVGGASLAALESDEQIAGEGHTRQFCLEGQKDFELVDSKEGQWTTITRC